MGKLYKVLGTKRRWIIVLGLVIFTIIAAGEKAQAYLGSVEEVNNWVNRFDNAGELYCHEVWWSSYDADISLDTTTYRSSPCSMKSMKVDYKFLGKTGGFVLVRTGNWDLTKWDEFSFYVKREKEDIENGDYFWIEFSDTSGRNVHYGPESRSCNDEFLFSKAACWKEFVINFHNDLPVFVPDKKGFSFANVNTIRIKIANREGAPHSAAVYFDDISLVACSNTYANPNEFSPNADDVNDTTEISYSLPVNAKVTIRIKNSSQTVVRTLLNSVAQTKGRIDGITWDGKNDNGVVVSDGDYTVEIDAGGNNTDSVTVSVDTDVAPCDGVWDIASNHLQYESPVCVWYNPCPFGKCA